VEESVKARLVALTVAVSIVAADADPSWAGPTEDASGSPTAAPAKTTDGLCSGVYVAATAMSDYRYDGFSESDRRPTWQANVHCYRTDGFYAGVVFTGVDFAEHPPTTLEVDYYAGRHIALGAAADLNLELLYTSFPNKRVRGPSYDFVEPQIELSRSFGALTLKSQLAWTPAYSSDGGQAWHLKETAAYAVTPWLTLSGHLGRLWIARGQDRTHWDAGATATWRRVSLDARYGGTDLRPAQCYFTDWCAPGAAVMLTWRLLP
jgi:uncharacterized protein (TIGR02001 family)